MTDLATKPGADEAPTNETTDVVATDATTPVLAQGNDDGSGVSYEWAPAEPAPRKRRLGWWIGVPAGLAVIGLVATSLVLIAPGTAVAGVPVGGMTPGAAADAIQNRLAETTIILTGDGDGVEVTGADLGASVDARALADAAFAENPMWNPTSWFSSPVEAEVTIDPDAATTALRAAAPDLYTDPTDATIAFDAATANYVVTPAVEGAGIDVDQVRSALQDAFAAGQTAVELDPQLAPVEAQTPTSVADSTVVTLTGILDTVGFYVGPERTVPIDRAVAASWLTVSPGDRGTFSITADEAAIQQVVDTLPALVNRAAVNATVITDSSGEVLREETAGVVGRALDPTDTVAASFAEQLSTGNGVYALPVTEAAFTTTSLARRIEVNLSEQRTYLYENGVVVNSYAISSGKSGTPTHTGNFRIYAHVRVQNMGCVPSVDYCTPDVPYVSYFNADEAFHGTYWHNNFGTPMSHGCVNMPIDVAQYVYNWAPIGTEVSVYS